MVVSSTVRVAQFRDKLYKEEREREGVWNLSDFMVELFW